MIIALRCFHDNFGDDALIITTYKIVKSVFPEAEIIFLCHNEQYIKRLLPTENIVVASDEDEISVDM